MPYGHEPPPDPHYDDEAEIRSELAEKTKDELEEELRHAPVGIPLTEFLLNSHREKRRRIIMELLGAFDHDPLPEDQR